MKEPNVASKYKRNGDARGDSDNGMPIRGCISRSVSVCLIRGRENPNCITQMKLSP